MIMSLRLFMRMKLKTLFLGINLIELKLIVSIFVRIFRRLSKKNCSITNAVTTESYELKEALLYCKLCLKTYIREFYPAG